MFRDSLAAGSRHVFMAVTPGNGSATLSRSVTDGQSAYVGGPYVAAPYWVKLVRSGDAFTGCASPDGTNWTVVGAVTNTMGSNVLFGLAITAGNPVLFNHAAFDNVSLVFSNGQPLYVTAAATADAATVLNQTFHFTAQGVAGNTAKSFDLTENPGVTIMAQGENAGAGEVAASAFDNSSATKWLDFATNNPATRASWIQCRQPNGLTCIVTQYTVTAANDAPERDPKNWRLRGSNDGGTNWFTLDTRTNQVFTNRFEKHFYSVASAAAGNLCRLQIDGVADAATANSASCTELAVAASATPSIWRRQRLPAAALATL